MKQLESFAKLFAAISLIFLAGCLNMPTPTTQITPAYISGLNYEKFDLEELELELNHLKQRESQLVIAQEQRIKTSTMQAFWWGYGQGDGIEATELAKIRGEIDAVRKSIDKKKLKNKI